MCCTTGTSSSSAAATGSVVAGVDDATARGPASTGTGRTSRPRSRAPTRRCRCCCWPISPSRFPDAVARGVDLQISGHTHGGQIWPFNFLVRLDQPVVQGLSRHGERTQLYTSRGTGFWGPPFRVFAPSEITVLTLRRG